MRFNNGKCIEDSDPNYRDAIRESLWHKQKLYENIVHIASKHTDLLLEEREIHLILTEKI